MDFLLTIVLFIIILGFLVFIHELGHFLAAKLVGVHPREFAIGFGKTLFQKEYADTVYKINMIPLGGYVSLEGEDDVSKEHGFRNKGFFPKFLILIGGVFMNFIFAIIFLGIFLVQTDFRSILTNFDDYDFSNTRAEYNIYPFGISEVNANWWDGVEDESFIYEVNGNSFNNLISFKNSLTNKLEENSNVELRYFDISEFEDSESTAIFKNQDLLDYYIVRVLEVVEGGRSDGILESGMNIIAINDQAFDNQEDFDNLIDTNQNKEVTFTILNEETLEESTVTKTLGERSESGAILDVFLDYNYLGFAASPFNNQFEGKNVYFVEYNQNLTAPLSYTYDLTMYQFEVLGNQVSESVEERDPSKAAELVGSPVAVGDSIGQVVETRVFSALFFLTGLVSLSLAIFNILPIPALDGGQIAVALFESIRGKKISDETLQKINLVGFMFLIGLSILLIFKDIFQFGIASDISEFFSNIFG